MSDRVKGTMMTDPARVARIARDLCGQFPQQESFWVLCLNTRNICTTVRMISLGTIDRTPVHPREIFRPAIMDSAKSIIIFHCHPSNDPAPSQADIDVTKTLVEAGKIVGIDVKDHVVVGMDMDEPLRFVSLREKGWM